MNAGHQTPEVTPPSSEGNLGRAGTSQKVRQSRRPAAWASAATVPNDVARRARESPTGFNFIEWCR